MRVGIDYLPAVTHAPGVGRYARELVRALVRLPGAPELFLFEVGGGRRALGGAALGLDDAPPGARVRRLRARVPRRLVRGLYRATGLGADSLLGGVDLFQRILPDQPPVRRAREVLAVPELPPSLLGRGSPADERLGETLRGMDGLLVFSAHYARELERRHGIDPARVHRVPVGCDHWLRDGWLRDGSGEGPDEGSAPGAEPTLLVLGALRHERHPTAVLAAFERLVAGGRAARLVFVGGPGTAAAALTAALARSPAAPRVRWERDVPEAEMPALVAGAQLLVHLADDEGTAVTPLEACAMGLAVVASRLPAFEEALDGEAVLVDEHESPVALADALERGLALERDPERRARRRALAARHTWQACASATVLAWEAIASGSPPVGGPANGVHRA